MDKEIPVVWLFNGYGYPFFEATHHRYRGEQFMRKVVVLFTVTVLCLGLLSAPVIASAARWDANSVWPPNNHHTIGLEEFAEMVAEKTDGNLEIVVHSGGALGYKGPELLKAVRDGLVPMSDMLTSGVAGDEPLFAIPTLPFLVRGFKEGKLLTEICRPYFDEVAEKQWKQKILYIAPWPAAGIWTQKELKKLSDMEGLKTRTYDKNGALVMKAVGATPYPLPFSEVYSSLATGLIDSVLTSTPTGVDGKFWEVLNYFQRIDITLATDLVTVNLKSFNKLDEQMQQKVIEAGREMEEIMWAKVEELDLQKEQICNDNGIVSVPVSAEFLDELTDITREIRKNWYDSAPENGKKIYDEFLEAVGREG